MVEHKSGAGDGHLQPHRERQPEKETTQKGQVEKMEFFYSNLSSLIVILEARISPSGSMSPINFSFP